jgi:hypothetical protein
MGLGKKIKTGLGKEDNIGPRKKNENWSWKGGHESVKEDKNWQYRKEEWAIKENKNELLNRMRKENKNGPKKGE